MITLLAAAIAYVLGAIPFGYVLVKWTTGRDVRSGGSGNIGATNVMRTTGRAAGIGTLLLDVGKGYLAVWIAGPPLRTERDGHVRGGARRNGWACLPGVSAFQRR
ncbi:MAG: glycerol-3-phosphate acyltransferase [Ignavibacteriota bacterium]